MLKLNKVIKNLLLVMVPIALLYATMALGADGPADKTTGLAGIATNVTGSFEAIGKLMIAVSYLAGIAFTIAAIFKFKQHKDNPQQIPLGTPLALLVIGIILIFLPTFVAPAGETVFGDAKQIGGYTGAGGTGLGGKPSTTPP